ncbi:hypothetical protein [Spirillospora sp. NPDC047279]|uniref:hypothetical protein n=1 Tax=Spirillospora sp. NPDC047279 TaxID=3155478 RepID=UPI00340B62F6
MRRTQRWVLTGVAGASWIFALGIVVAEVIDPHPGLHPIHLLFFVALAVGVVLTLGAWLELRSTAMSVAYEYGRRTGARTVGQAENVTPLRRTPGRH